MGTRVDITWNEFVPLLLTMLTAPEQVKEGRFQAMMEVELVNDGRVTLLLDSEKVF